MPKAIQDKLYSTRATLKTSFVVVRAFNGSKREMMGEITLPIRIGPTTFDITFQLPPGQTLDPCSRGFIVNERGIEEDPDKVKAICKMPAPRIETKVQVLGDASCPRPNSTREAPNPLHDNAGRINGLYLGARRCLWKERAIHLVSQQEIHKLRTKIPNTRANLLCSSLDSKKAKKVHASLYYMAHIQDRPPQSLLHEFSNEHIMTIEETESKCEPARWKLWFDGASNLLGNGIRAVLASLKGQCFLFSTKLGFDYTNNIAKYEAYSMGITMALEH
ncbi:hypothetical protein CR513_03582, partial [Mucuna pruriens]